MPEADLRLAELPAEVDDLAVSLGRKVDQAQLDVLQVRTALLDLLDEAVELFDQGARRRSSPDELLRRQGRDVDTGLARQVAHLVVQAERTTLQSLDEYLETRQDGVRFLEAERLLVHGRRDASGSPAECRARGRGSSCTCGTPGLGFQLPWPTRIRRASRRVPSPASASTASTRTSAASPCPRTCRSCRCAASSSFLPRSSRC